MDKVGKRRFRTLIPALALIVAGLVAGCSSTDSVAGASPSAGTSASVQPSVSGSPAAFCAAADQLQTSIKDLRSVNVITGGVAAVQEALGTIQTNLDAFQSAAKDQFGPEIAKLRTSLAGVQESLQAARSNMNVSTLTAIATSIGGVVTSYTALQTQVTSRCG